MPSWKKVIINGSDSTLNSLIVTNGITGSLFGTASYVTQALSASYANVSSLGGFVQGGNSFGTTATLGTNDYQSLGIETNGSIKLFISSSGNIGIGTSTPSAKLDINGDTNVTGTLTATVKSFVINHPTKEGKKLQYGVLEGPEHSVYVRGRLTNENVIILPDHWHALVHEGTITVNLTSIGKKQDLWVEEVNAYNIVVGYKGKLLNCFYTVFAERKDVEKLVTEFVK